MMVCFSCGGRRVRLRPATDLSCIMGETVLCQCLNEVCGTEWFDDTDKAKKLLKERQRDKTA